MTCESNLPQGKPAGFIAPRGLSGGVQREVSNNFTLCHDVGDHFALDVSHSKVSSGPAIG